MTVSGRPQRRGRVLRRALAGAVAAAVALAVSELVTALLPTVPSLVTAVGQEVVDGVPAWLEDAAIDMFGTNDKRALAVGIVVSSVAVGAVLGVGAGRHFSVATVGLAVFASLGVLAVAQRGEAEAVALAAVAAATAVAAALLALFELLEPAGRSHGASPGAIAARRRFLHLSAGLGVVAAGTAVAARYLARALPVGTDPRDVRLASVDVSRPPAPADASFDVEGLSPLFTPNDDFYRIDTALSVPRVEIDEWRLQVRGMVDRPVELTYDELLAMPQVEADITLACVSNEVGGGLVGNARWQGVRLADVLERARVERRADQVVARSVDGWTAGFPTEIVLDGGDALVAVGMNGEPLPLRHGFPARLVVPGLYGYISATKWLTELELATLDAFDAYWVRRGWAKHGQIKTQSRIDVPRDGAHIAPGERTIAGVAWAPTRGIVKVEVSVDDRPWRAATLAEALGPDTWRQWRLRWEAAAGRHEIRVRATDGQGETQPAERSGPRPDGATGYHTIQVTVG